MKKAILRTLAVLAFFWCMCPPVDDMLDMGWFIGELVGFAVVAVCATALKKYYPEDDR